MRLVKEIFVLRRVCIQLKTGAGHTTFCNLDGRVSQTEFQELCFAFNIREEEWNDGQINENRFCPKQQNFFWQPPELFMCGPMCGTLFLTIFYVLYFYSYTVKHRGFLSTFLRNFFLCQDHWHGDVPPHLAQPLYVALGRALDSGLMCPRFP